MQRLTDGVCLFVLAADVTAEELFNMFFGGSFGGQNVYVRRGRQWERQGRAPRRSHGQSVKRAASHGADGPHGGCDLLAVTCRVEYGNVRAPPHRNVTAFLDP